MTPTVGRIVHVLLREGMQQHNNGAYVAPAIITRVWSRGRVNVKVFTDGPTDMWLTRVPLLVHAAAAQAYQVDQPGQAVAFWPERP